MATLTLSQQAAIVLEAAEDGLLRADGIVRWADSVIVVAEKPEPWLIELSTLNPLDITGFVSCLRDHAAQSLPLRIRVQIIALAWEAGLLTVASSLPLLFRVLITDNKGEARDSADERLADALVEWDCLENLHVIPPELHSTFEASFRGYLSDVQEISAVLCFARTTGS